MQILIPTKKQIALATDKTEQMKQECLKKYGKPYPPNSMKKGDGIFLSLVCEAALCDFYGMTFVAPEERDDYDVYHPKHFGRVDNKTKIRTVAPKPEYLGTVAEFNTRQQCDFYCFTSILKDASKLWIAGFCRKEIFFNRATFSRKGTVDPTSDRGWRFKADCWNLPYGEMLPPPDPDNISADFYVDSLRKSA